MESAGVAERLGQLALFADLRWAELEAVAHTFDEEVFAAGQRVLRQGLTGSAFYVMLDGEATVTIDGVERRAARPWRLLRRDLGADGRAAERRRPGRDAAPLPRPFPGRSSRRFLLERPAVMLRLLQAEARRLRDSNRWQ